MAQEQKDRRKSGRRQQQQWWGGDWGRVAVHSSLVRQWSEREKERQCTMLITPPFSISFPLSPHTYHISSMSNNPMLVKDKAFPLYEDNRKFKFSKMFRSNNVLQTLLKALKEYFGKQQQRLRWPALVGKGFHHYAPPVTIRYQR
jgi:hypothetical protein